MKNILYSLKENLIHFFRNFKNELPELLKFMKQHKLISLVSIVIAILAIFLIVNITGISKTVNVTVLSKYSKEYVKTEDKSTYSYHIIVNKKGIFGTKETEYFVSNKDLYDSIKPELNYKFKIINSSYIIKASEINTNK